MICTYIEFKFVSYLCLVTELPKAIYYISWTNEMKPAQQTLSQANTLTSLPTLLFILSEKKFAVYCFASFLSCKEFNQNYFR